MSNESERLWIKACVSGYSQTPCTLIAAYDHGTGMLVFTGASLSIDPHRERGMLIVTTQSRMDDFDSLFTSELFGEAITAFNNMHGYYHFATPEVKRCDPSGAIAIDGYDETGPQVRINESVTNEKVAALAIFWVVSGQVATMSSLSMSDEINGFLQGGFISVGGAGITEVDDSLGGPFDFDDVGPLGRVFRV